MELRADLKRLKREVVPDTAHDIGGPGRKAGEFFHLHGLGVDPQENIVTGESQDSLV